MNFSRNSPYHDKRTLRNITGSTSTVTSIVRSRSSPGSRNVWFSSDNDFVFRVETGQGDFSACSEKSRDSRVDLLDGLLMKPENGERTAEACTGGRRGTEGAMSPEF